MTTSVTAKRLTEAILTAGVAITGVSIGDPANKLTYLVVPASLQVAAQPTIAAFDNSAAADSAYVNSTARTTGADAVTNDHTATWKGLRGAASVLVDEINLLREWNTGLAAAVAAATSLADLKTRVALLPALPDRTLAQAKTAITAAINSGTVD